MNRCKVFIISGLILAAALVSGCAARAWEPADGVGASVIAHAAAPGTAGGQSGAGSIADDSLAGKRLSEFSTEFKGATKARAHNIALASKAIDQTVVPPGAVFSFNETVGPTNKARGYKLGRIFINGKDAEGYGGGVCQVSSTLFNAVSQAGLEVVERHAHSKAVTYVKNGWDATTSYGGRDFRFTNSLPVAVRVRSAVNGEKLTVGINTA